MGTKITHGRIKPKYNGKNKKKITRHERDFLQWAKSQDLPCFVCGDYGSIELHHVKHSSCDPKVHTEIIPLCGEKCHRLGTELSAHGTPVLFRNKFPLEVQRDFANDLYSRFLKEIV